MSQPVPPEPAASEPGADPRVVVVSNRLPIAFRDAGGGSLQIARGPGGLARALEPLVERSGGTWIGWPGITSDEIEPDALQRALRARRAHCPTGGGHPGEGGVADRGSESGDGGDRFGCDLCIRPLSLSQDEVAGYYAGFSNSVLWPCFHGLTDRCELRHDDWEMYQRVNRRFADAVGDALEGDRDLVWIHDYHLLLVAAWLRARGTSARLGFFLHTPFPTLDDFLKLPWRGDLLRALLAHDLIGFQSARDLRAFLTCVDHLVAGAEVSRRGEGASVIELDAEDGERRAVVGVFPIGIDVTPFATGRVGDRVAREVEALRGNAGERKLIVGVDRLDYTKGLPERLRAYERALARHPQLREQVTFVQVVVPSRESVPAYAALKGEIDRLVGRIAGGLATTSWEPIRYLYTSLAPEELLALYRGADIALVTPLADGMNLVAKEYCAAQIGGTGVLVLSELAGAACQLQDGAVLVNPYDADGVADAIWRAHNMSQVERRERMRRLRDTVVGSDVHAWGDAFLSSLLREEPAPATAAEYLPMIDLEPRQAPGV